MLPGEPILTILPVKNVNLSPSYVSVSVLPVIYIVDVLNSEFGIFHYLLTFPINSDSHVCFGALIR